MPEPLAASEVGRPGSAPRAAPGLAPWALALVLVASVAAVYEAVRGQGFVNFDDGRYLYQNARVRAGLTGEGVRWAFGSVVVGNWHPLTVISLMADVELFGVSARATKLVNVALHALNAGLVLAFLRAATGSLWRGALAAALFALHPLRVESVAWVSERKDVLSTLFWLLALLGWVRFVRRPSAARYALVALAFALGLMAKPMLVTLPLTLLLVDVWPLGRLAPRELLSAKAWPLLREKLPLLALSLAASAAAVLSQRAGGAVAAEESIPLPARLGNAAASAVAYLGKALWPADLAVIYPHPALAGGLAAWKVVAALAVLGAISAVAALQARTRPWLLFGWGWYLVTLLPVAGIVQVGLQGMADRYTYVPLLGPAIAVAWTAGEWAGRGEAARLAVPALASAALVALGAAAHGQVSVWKDSFTLFGHALSATGEGNALAWRNLGVAHLDAGRPDLALPALAESVRLGPYDAHAWMNLGIASLATGDVEGGAAHLQRAARMKPSDPYVWFNLGLAAAMLGRWDEAALAEDRLTALGSDLAPRLGERVRARQGR